MRTLNSQNFFPRKELQLSYFITSQHFGGEVGSDVESPKVSSGLITQYFLLTFFLTNCHKRKRLTK